MTRVGLFGLAAVGLLVLTLLQVRLPSAERAPEAPNAVPWIPPQCWAKAGASSNGCFVCHQTPRSPNFIEDADLQTRPSFARVATVNPWRNMFSPPPAVALSDPALLELVRKPNYLVGREADCAFRFDSEGFDIDPSGALTGWRAFAYLPLPGTFLPTNGSDGDAMIRLPPAYREDEAGTPSLEIYRVNLALLEAYARRADVELLPTDERALGVDLDGDGALGIAQRISFAWPVPAGRPLHYVGRAAELDPAVDGRLVAGLFPKGTELLHTVRYFDVVAGAVGPAARVKEVRRMRKTRWLTYAQLEQNALAEAREKEKSPNAMRHPQRSPSGMLSGTGWELDGLIEDARGTLRAQTTAELAGCIGCHGGVGVTTDSTFSFTRKLPGRDGWRYAAKTQLAGVSDPLRADGEGEYAHWLRTLGAADDFFANREAQDRFFARGQPRADALAALASDVSTLLVPSPERALELNRAYLGLVRAQRFEWGREVALSPPQAHRTVEQGQPTEVAEPIAPAWVRRPVALSR